jgi:hypothetical protein
LLLADGVIDDRDKVCVFDSLEKLWMGTSKDGIKQPSRKFQ